MKIYRVAFIGHREFDHIPNIEKDLYTILSVVISTKEYVEFYVGRNGDFDISVASTVKKIQKDFRNHNSRLILVQPYPMKDDPYYETYYDELLYPLPRDVYPKAAMQERNKWLIDNCDLLITYVKNTEGGAYEAYEYAEKRGKRILQLANGENI